MCLYPSVSLNIKPAFRRRKKVITGGGAQPNAIGREDYVYYITRPLHFYHWGACPHAPPPVPTPLSCREKLLNRNVRLSLKENCAFTEREGFGFEPSVLERVSSCKNNSVPRHADESERYWDVTKALDSDYQIYVYEKCWQK